MSYKYNTGSNRDALFGPGPSSNKSPKSSARSSEVTKNVILNRSNTTTTRTTTTTSSSTSVAMRKSALDSLRNSSSRLNHSSSSQARKSAFPVRTLSGTVKLQKMKEAEEFRAQAKKAMTRGVFSKPDPVIAGTYYKRAADIYKQCGENRLERLHRIASADCQRGQEAYAIAASEYTRAAELVEMSDEKVGRKQNESYQLNKNAADAWRNLNEMGRAGESLIKAALGLLIGVEPDKDGYDANSGGSMEKKALIALLDAIEFYLPDPLNRFKSMRTQGKSMYTPDSNTPEAHQAMFQLALQNIVTTSYAHESVSKAVRVLAEFGEYSNALYGAGAVTALLEHERTATISLSRAYLSETVLQLAMNDVVAAEKTFMEVHLQNNTYLSSRECKLAEELIRAIKMMDFDALETAKIENNHAIANLDPTLQYLVTNMKMMGVTKRSPSVKVTTAHSTMPNSQKIPKSSNMKNQSKVVKESCIPSTEDNFNEMMQVMDEMGLGDDSNGDDLHSNNRHPESTEHVEDDEIDLR